ncbi:cupin domain-containing protein [Enteractinococcus helveticum]|nr:cupin domain-containing protein [Enteractinococcus helveticum]
MRMFRFSGSMQHLVQDLSSYAETWVDLQGEVLIETQDEQLQVDPGDIVTVSAESVHRFRNRGQTNLRMLCIHPSPTIIEEFV